MSSFVKKVFADAIKDLEMRTLSWIIWVGPKSNDKGPYKRCMKEKTDR